MILRNISTSPLIFCALLFPENISKLKIVLLVAKANKIYLKITQKSGGRNDSSSFGDNNSNP